MAVLDVIVIVKDEIPELLATDGGLKVQVAPVGSPAHEKVTVWLNPKLRITLTVEVAEFPAVVFAGELAESSNPGGAMLRSTPAPGPQTKTMSGRPSPFMSTIGKAGLNG